MIYTFIMIYNDIYMIFIYMIYFTVTYMQIVKAYGISRSPWP